MLPLPGYDIARTVVRYRYGAQTTNAAGERVRGAEASVAIRAVVRDLDMREIRTLPEGWRQNASIGVTSEVEIRAANDVDGTGGDVIEVDGERHTVVKVGSGPPVGPLPRVYDAICIREPRRAAAGWTA